MRAVIIQHEANQSVERFEPALRAAGFALVTRFRGVERSDIDAELVVVLGGQMSVADESQHPFLGAERAFLAERLAGDRPCLGLCLGAQLLASAAGAEVFAGKNGFEVGAAPVRWSKDGLGDPAIRGVSPKTVVAHWHRDTFRPVPGAVLLASTDRYTQQAFRLGRSYAFQFHLELGADELSAWLEESPDELTAAKVDATLVREQLGKLRGAEGELADLRARLAFHFAKAARQA